MKAFMDKDFLLDTDTAKKLFTNMLRIWIFVTTIAI